MATPCVLELIMEPAFCQVGPPEPLVVCLQVRLWLLPAQDPCLYVMRCHCWYPWQWERAR